MASHDWLIHAYNKVLHNFDLIHAKYRLSVVMKAVKPNLSTAQVIEVNGALHPILNAKNNKENKPTYGQNVYLDKTQRILVI